MKVVFGLGNPGAKYEHTRHNAGFDVLSKTAAFFQVSLKKRCFRNYAYAKVPGGIIVEPYTYMNLSGNVIRYFKKYIKNPDDLLVICDNMDFAVGGLRIKQGGGASGQKGLNSITEALGTSDFVRMYVGIGRPAEGVAVTDHVLEVEKNPEKKAVYNQALEDASKAVIRFLDGKTVGELQSEFNRKGLF